MGAEKDDSKIYFPNLDVVRFIAAFMVVILHAYETWTGWFGQLTILSGGTHTTLSKKGKFIDTVLNNMGLGVDIFFLLSGFLITYILLEEKKKFGAINIKNFMIRRAIRIWPLYFFLIALAPFLVRWVDTPSPDYWFSILFVNNFHTITTHDWTYPFAHFWSICVEEHFYIFWPFIIAFVPKKRLLSLFAGLVFLSIAFRIYTYYSNPDPWYTLYLHTLSRLDILVIGATGAWFYSEKKFEFALSRTTRILIFTTLLISLSLESSSLWSSMFMAGFKNYFYLGLFSILLLDYNFNSNYKHWLRPRSFIHYLGKISYGIYMYGNIVLLIIVKNILYKYGIYNLYWYMVFVVVLSIVVPILSYELMEKPILKLKNRFTIIKTER